MTYCNGQAITLNAAPSICHDRTMVPLRFVGDSLGLEVGWDEVTRTVTLTSR